MTAIINGSSTGRTVQVDLEQRAPLMPGDELRSFVQRFVARRSRYLDILQGCPPPVYVLEGSVLRERSARFQAAFRCCLPEVGFYYAVKSNNHPDVSRILLQTGMGLDVSSGLELETALGLGAEDVVFSGPGKTDQELQLAALNGDRVTILIDSFGELARLQQICAGAGRVVRVGVRLTTNASGLWRKFGIVPEKLGMFWAKAQECANLRFQGLQFHTSWNLSPAAQIDFIRYLGSILGGLPGAALEQIRFIDIGGGYWPPQGEWLQAAGTSVGKLKMELGQEPGSPYEHYRLPASPIELFTHQISDAIHESIHSVVACRICVEPGRWLCNDAMHLLLSVVDKKEDDLVITDAGTNAVGWERFETDYFPVINLSRPALEEKACYILGSLCTPHDVWGYSYWGEEIGIGDILLVPTQGAYTYSLRQHFIKPLPRVITI